MTDEDDVRRVINRFGQAFATGDSAALIDLWDADYDSPVYQPEETLEPLTSHVSLREYINDVPSVIAKVTDVHPLEFHLDVLGDIAVAFTRTRLTLHFARAVPPLDGEVRQSFVLRKRAERWQFIHYHESRLTPLEGFPR